MNKLTRVIILIISIFISERAFAADPASTPSDIREVTVYLNGAEVNRYGEASISPGENEIVFGGLSNFIDPNSISVSGGGNAVITSVNYVANYLKYQKKPDNVIALETERDTLALKIEFVKNDISALHKELALLDTNSKMSVGPKSEYVPDLQDLAEYYHKQVTEVKNKISRLNLKRKQMEEKYYDLKKQINQFTNYHDIPSSVIFVHLSSTVYSTGYFKISYFVKNAHWNPIYDLRAVTTNDPIKLDYDAMVVQQSGEDWNNIKLTLSTGNPVLGGNKPELNEWYIDFYKPRTLTTYHEEMKYNKAATPASEGASYDSTSRLDMKTSADYTTVTQSQTTTIFDINLKYDIPSDAEGRQVQVQQYVLPAQFIYSATPKLDPDAFLFGSTTGWGDYNLLPGNANIFFEGAYVGKSFIDPDQTGDSLPISFGRDKRIVIQRVKVKDYSKKQLFGGNQTQAFAFAYSVKNTKNTAVTLRIEDQLPISKTKDITVQAQDLSNADYDVETGKVTWMLILKPGETQKFNFSYSVKYPKNKVVEGVN